MRFPVLLTVAHNTAVGSFLKSAQARELCEVFAVEAEVVLQGGRYQES